jgi:hypothetical protein
VSQLRLFDLPGLPRDAPEPEKLSYTRRLTLKRQAILASGFNPGSRRTLLDPAWGYRCKDCAHCLPAGRNRTYWKCDLNPLGYTRGPATDIRVGWPACTALRITQES